MLIRRTFFTQTSNISDFLVERDSSVRLDSFLILQIYLTFLDQLFKRSDILVRKLRAVRGSFRPSVDRSRVRTGTGSWWYDRTGTNWSDGGNSRDRRNRCDPRNRSHWSNSGDRRN